MHDPQEDGPDDAELIERIVRTKHFVPNPKTGRGRWVADDPKCPECGNTDLDLMELDRDTDCECVTVKCRGMIKPGTEDEETCCEDLGSLTCRSCGEGERAEHERDTARDDRATGGEA